MILIVSSNPRERTALLALCESRGWPGAGCDSVRALRRRAPSIGPCVIVTRHKLTDGYSDDVLALLAEKAPAPPVRIVVLLGAAAPAAQEARQLALGADLTLRDPVRADVLLEYLGKYRRLAKPLGAGARRPAPCEQGKFAGATIDWAERRLTHGGQSVVLAPREAQLVELLVEARGSVVTYETLYAEILGRRFTGDTGNLRVLLVQLVRRAAAIGLSVREWVEVLSKAGYRLRPEPARPTPPDRR